jgi:diaminopimelate decarboxylase
MRIRRIRSASARNLLTAFRAIPHGLLFGKANSNLSILRLLAKLGCGFDVVSGGELERDVCRPPGSKKLSSPVSARLWRKCGRTQAGILLFNIESTSELALLAECGETEEDRAHGST